MQDLRVGCMNTHMIPELPSDLWELILSFHGPLRYVPCDRRAFVAALRLQRTVRAILRPRYVEGERVRIRYQSRASSATLCSAYGQWTHATLHCTYGRWFVAILDDRSGSRRYIFVPQHGYLLRATPPPFHGCCAYFADWTLKVT